MRHNWQLVQHDRDVDQYQISSVGNDPIKMLPVPVKGTGGRLRRQLSVTTRRELIEAVAARYRAAGRNQKKEILDEFVKVTGFHRKHAIRALKRSPRQESSEPRQRARIYDEAIREALTIVWEPPIESVENASAR